MNRRQETISLWSPLARMIGGTLAFSGMVHLYLTDAALWNALWPASFHSNLVRLFGGELKVITAGDYRTVISGLDIVWRLAAISLCCAVLRATVLSVLPRPSRNTDTAVGGLARGDQWCRSFLETCGRIGIVWLCSLVWLMFWLAAEFLPGSVIAESVYLSQAFWPSMILSATICAVWPDIEPGSANDAAGQLLPTRRGWIPVVGLGLMTIVWIAVSFWMNERLYAGLWIPHGDSAMYEEHLWNVWHGKGFRSYLDQGLFLGEHVQVIHLLLLPLHMLWPSHLMLELMESIALGICVIPIYSMALRYSGSRPAAAWLGVTWLLFYPMHFLDIAIDLKTLRPSCYGLPFLLWGIDLAERHRLKAATICMVIAMSAQEDFALVIGPVCFVLWWQQRKQPGLDSEARATAVWSLTAGILSILYVLAVVLLIIPAFRSGAAVHYSRYFGDLGNSPGDLVRTALRDPLRVLSQLLTVRTFLYVLVFSVPLGCLVFRSPLRLLAGAATFTMLSLIQLGSSSDSTGIVELPPVPYHHFHAPLLAVLFWAAAAGLRPVSWSLVPEFLKRTGMRRVWSAERAARFACGCAAFTAITGSLMPIGAAFWSPESRTSYWNLFVPGPRAEELEKLLPLLPRESRIASTDYVHTRLTHYERSYDYSDYLRAVNNYQPGVPADTEYIVIDTQHPYSTVRSPADVRELQEQPLEWELQPDITNGYFILLKRIR